MATSVFDLGARDFLVRDARGCGHPRGRLDLTRLARTVCDHIRGSEPARALICAVQEGVSVDTNARLVAIVVENLGQST